MNQIQRDRLEKLAKLHDMQKPESLDMSGYFKPCGTPSCSLGWATTIFPELLKCIRPPTEEEAKWGVNGVFLNMKGAELFFGIDSDTAADLFGAVRRTPTQQADYIRKVIANTETTR